MRTETKPKISIIYVTARVSHCLLKQPLQVLDTHHFKLFLDSLVGQTFKDFEVLICDVLYKERIKEFEEEKEKKNEEDKFDFSEYPFSIKHLDPTEFSWARKKGLICIADNFNLGIIHANGELLLWFNDCCELVDSGSLQLWWDWYQKGYFANGLVVYYKNKVPLMVNDSSTSDILHLEYLSKEDADLAYKKMIDGGYWKDIVRDSRWKFVEDIEKKTGVGIYHSYGSQYYAYSSSSLEAALNVNGYDSNFDGDKSLIDIEMGLRLERLGCKFICDKRLWLIEHAHINYPEDRVIQMSGNMWRSNYSLMILNQNKNKITANDYKLSDSELEWIINHGTKWGVPRPEVGSKGYELLMDWFNNPPIFNLRELRNERLKSEGKI